MEFVGVFGVIIGRIGNMDQYWSNTQSRNIVKIVVANHIVVSKCNSGGIPVEFHQNLVVTNQNPVQFRCNSGTIPTNEIVPKLHQQLHQQ